MNDDPLAKQFLKESNAIESVYGTASLKAAFKAWHLLLKKDTLNIKDVLQAHDFLMRQHLKWEERGQWRSRQVWIGGREGKPWYAIPALMTQWIDNANDFVVRINHEDPLLEELIKDFHIRFEEIHPFIDGNGRMGRILLNWMRVKVGLPILVIKEKEKYEYYEWFKRVEFLVDYI